MTTKTDKANLVAQQNDTFNKVLEACKKVSVWHECGERMKKLIRLAYDGCFKQNGQFRKTCPNWCGYVRNDNSIDENARLQCLQSAFCRMLHYHLGIENAYLGTIINATENLASMAEAYELIPHLNVPRNLWQLASDSDEYKVWKPYKDANKIAKKRFADNCDTFCQVLTYLATNGRKSSAGGEVWRKALGMN